MGRRTLLLIASILVAAVGTGLVGLFALNADDRARRGSERVPVLVAVGPIAAGAVPNAATAQVRQRPRGDLPEQYLTALSAIKGRATYPILAGQVLQAGMFSEAGPASQQSKALPDGFEAVSIDITDPQRVAPLLVPDSQVHVWYTTKDEEPKTEAVFTGPVTVVAVGPTTTGGLADTAALAPDPRSTAGKVPQAAAAQLPLTNVTLALKQDQVKRLLDAQAKGTLYLSWVKLAPAVTPVNQ